MESIRHKYKFEEIISLVKRDNNKKRKFLFLNKLQAKYVPSNPKDTLNLFKSLGERLLDLKLDEKVVIIGFAETATAIGATIADLFGEKAYYIHTTREFLDEKDLIVHFEEEHSHATTHNLYSDNREIISECDSIIFVDDELTTGKTIYNFIDALKKENVLKDNVKLVAASIINCMSDINIENLRKRNILVEYLIRQEKEWENIEWSNKYLVDIECKNENFEYEYEVIKGRIDLRKGSYIKEYKNAIIELCNKIQDKYKIDNNEKQILILGTEEFMYPAIFLADKLKEKYKDKEVLVHATSRSPILPVIEENYPIHNRNKVESFYDKKRKVFIYNLKKYDRIFILTDANEIRSKAINDVISVLSQYNNKNISVIKWEEK